MISVTDLRAGTTFEENGQLFQVLSYEHIKMGRGSANIKIKVKNVKNGATVEKSYINGAKVNNVHVLKKDMQFLYKDQDACYFMNPNTYEQVAIPLRIVPEHSFFKEGESFSVSFLNDEPLSIMLPVLRQKAIRRPMFSKTQCSRTILRQRSLFLSIRATQSVSILAPAHTAKKRKRFWQAA